MISSPVLSVVIPVHNGRDWITDQLDAVAQSINPLDEAEVVVVDNRSTDDTQVIVRRWSDTTGQSVRLVEAFERAGEPYARNVGWSVAHSDRIAYCDADDEVSAPWASAMVEGLTRSIYTTGPLDTRKLNPAGLAEMRGQTLFKQLPLLHNEVPFAHGCNMGYTRHALELLSGFNETYLIGCDIEIAVRAWREGLQLTWSPDALVHYRFRSDWAGIYGQARAYGKARHRIDALLPDLAHESTLKHQLRRAAWLLRKVALLTTPEGRLRWAWIAGQVDGEIRGYMEARTR